jgi:hypothetical protein
MFLRRGSVKWAHRVEGLRATFSARQARLKRARDRTASCAIVPAVVEHARLLTVAFEPTISQLTIRPVAGAGNPRRDARAGSAHPTTARPGDAHGHRHSSRHGRGRPVRDVEAPPRRPPESGPTAMTIAGWSPSARGCARGDGLVQTRRRVAPVRPIAKRGGAPTRVPINRCRSPPEPRLVLSGCLASAGLVS